MIFNEHRRKSLNNFSFRYGANKLENVNSCKKSRTNTEPTWKF